MTQQDEQIIKLKISKGDHEAFAAVFREYFSKTFLFLRSFVKSEDEAKDLSQNVFCKIWKHRKTLPQVVSLDDYIFMMARNEALDFFRKASRKDLSLDKVLDGYLMTVYQSSIDDNVSAKMELENLRETLADLPEQRRDIYMLSRFMGVDNGKIAEMLNISKKTVENQISIVNSEVRKKRMN